MTESALVEEKKLKVKRSKHPWHEAGCGPCESMVVEKEQRGKAHAIRAALVSGPTDGSVEMKSE